MKFWYKKPSILTLPIWSTLHHKLSDCCIVYTALLFTMLECCKIASSILSWIIAHLRIFRLFMNRKFDPYVMRPLDRKVQNWIKTGDLKNWQTYFTTYKMVQMSNVRISNGLPMHQNFILKLFEPLGHIQFLYRTVLIRIYFFALLLWFFEFGRIFELCKMHWIYQNWLRILQYNSKIYFIICCQAFWIVKLSFENKFWYGLPAFVT